MDKGLSVFMSGNHGIVTIRLLSRSCVGVCWCVERDGAKAGLYGDFPTLLVARRRGKF